MSPNNYTFLMKDMLVIHGFKASAESTLARMFKKMTENELISFDVDRTKLSLGDIAKFTDARTAWYCVRGIPKIPKPLVLNAVFPTVKRVSIHANEPIVIECVGLIEQYLTESINIEQSLDACIKILSGKFSEEYGYIASGYAIRAVLYLARSIYETNKKSTYRVAQSGIHAQSAVSYAAFRETSTKPENRWLSGPAHDASELAIRKEDALQVIDICNVCPTVFFKERETLE